MPLANGVDLPDWAAAAGLLAAMVALTGVADFALTRAGYDALAALTWAVGYGGAVIVVWAVWLRELEFDPGG